MAAGLIEEAISVGAPAYNAGDIDLCAEIYAATASQLLDTCGRELDEQVARDLEATLQASISGRKPSAKDVAWSFRRAFDAQLERGGRPKRAQEGLPRPADLVAEAISRGAPAYNRGDIAGCVRIYTSTARALVERGDLDRSCRSALSSALQQVEASRDANANAWALRKALDAVAGSSSGAGGMVLPAARGEAPAGRSRGGALIHDFVQNTGLDVRAGVVNDTVMGGRSSSRLGPSGQGLVFQGEVTRQGGGGFASVRFEAMDAGALQRALASGDGIAFTVRLVEGCSAWKFQLLEGYDNTQWQVDFTASASGAEQRVPFSRFMPSWRGRPRGSMGLTANAAKNISAFGFMLSFLSDGGRDNAAFREGPFALGILRVEVY